jgi:hypothetical protein
LPVQRCRQGESPDASSHNQDPVNLSHRFLSPPIRRSDLYPISNSGQLGSKKLIRVAFPSK